MNVFDRFSIPYKGMGIGIHHLEYDIDSSFLAAFESSHIDNGSFVVKIELDKRHDSSILNFDVDGHTKAACDRCTADIDLPVYGSYTMHIKLSEEGESNEEILYVHPETSVINLAQLIYEYILLSVPLTKVYDCEEDEVLPCNLTVLDKLGAIEPEDDSDTTTGGVWDSLKGLNLDN